jgi:hypothetical protein
MKKALLVLILVLSVFPLMAQTISVYTVGYMQTGRSYTISNVDVSQSFSGLGGQYLTLIGEGPVGFGMNITAMYPLAVSETIGSTKTDIDLSIYDSTRLSVGMSLGPVFNFHEEEFSYSVLPALHANGVSLEATDDLIDSYNSIVFGLGVIGVAYYELNDMFSLAVSAELSYDFLDVLMLPDEFTTDRYNGGLTFGLSFGVGIKPLKRW